jgi:hypothetical protein
VDLLDVVALVEPNVGDPLAREGVGRDLAHRRGRGGAGLVMRAASCGQQQDPRPDHGQQRDGDKRVLDHYEAPLSLHETTGPGGRLKE